MPDNIQEKLAKYHTAVFDARFHNTNQIKHCWQNYLNDQRCLKALTAKGEQVTSCEWYHKMYKSMCPISQVTKWDEHQGAKTFLGKL
ncbi:cytochrome c oxidase subunit 6B1-like [Erpetoichthys calabaricus]|uniref:Cytochrome c oxidase subunit 6B1 n=1 Tax=Erpetoichthys calabaricus TaxID=27687 RepID=A0A8C4S1D5_ERPCA|nr:cytochrome c oxidase subunit 6B1-like [Erpetoichthys calabaricus]